uniref:Uncharacterized protein n=1 Tax=Salix viminalis TaxID=40686 RepID=A0A6N2L191_SALVM
MEILLGKCDNKERKKEAYDLGKQAQTTSLEMVKEEALSSPTRAPAPIIVSSMPFYCHLR